MPASSDVLHTAVRNSRRLRGRAQIARVTVSGVAPSAVVRALKGAAVGFPTPEERLWVRRIELTRQLLLTSPKPLEIIDFGAGAGHRFDTAGDTTTTHTTTRSLGEMARSSKPPRWAYLLFRLVRELKPEAGMEMGACVGISASYQAAAMELNGSGRLVSLEGSQVLADRSARTLDELGLDHRASIKIGRFSDTVSEVIDELSPLGWAFIDGHHVEAATIDYMEQILHKVADEAVLVFDDINWSPGMRKAWQTIVDDERFAMTVDLRSVGLAVVSRSGVGRRNLRVGYY